MTGYFYLATTLGRPEVTPRPPATCTTDVYEEALAGPMELALTGHSASGYSGMSTDQICDAIVAGEPWAGSALYARVEDTIGAVLFRTLGYRDDEFDDLMQQAREKVFNSVVSGQFARRCTLKIWAARITQRIAVDAVRNRVRERTLMDRSVTSDQLAALPSVADTPERSIELRRRLGALRMALAAIKRERAEVLILHDLGGHKLTDIAKIKGVSVAAAQSRLVRGRREVAERIRRLKWET